MHLCVNIVAVTVFGQIVIQWWRNQPEIIGNQWDCVKKARKTATAQEESVQQVNSHVYINIFLDVLVGELLFSK